MLIEINPLFLSVTKIVTKESMRGSLMHVSSNTFLHELNRMSDHSISTNHCSNCRAIMSRLKKKLIVSLVGLDWSRFKLWFCIILIIYTHKLNKKVWRFKISRNQLWKLTPIRYIKIHIRIMFILNVIGILKHY